jgi:hypothetical protein
MEGVRRVARAVLKYFSPLMFIAILVQIFLAGEGIFGIKHVEKDLGDAKTLDPHRAFGYILAEPVALLFLIFALLAWYPVQKVRRVSILLPFLVFAQDPLSWGGRWSGAFHPLNAFLVLGLFGWLSGQLHRGQPASSGDRPEAAATVQT